LSFGQILNRTFSFYRNNFFLFFSIVAIPQFLAFSGSFLASYIARSVVGPGAPSSPLTSLGYPGIALLLGLLLAVCSIVYLFMQGGTFLAVSELYMGRSTTIEASLRRVYANFGSLLGVALVGALAIVGGVILFIIPGIYVTSRLLVSIPVALVEKRGPRESLRRSFELTRGFAGRSLLILLLVAVLNYAVTLLVTVPIHFLASEPAMLPFWTIVSLLWTVAASVLVSPVLLIATSIFYYDLRVRKENFDLRFMAAADLERPADLESGESVG